MGMASMYELGFAAVAHGIALHCSSEMFMFFWAARYFERMVKHPGDYFAIFMFGATAIFLYELFSRRGRKGGRR